MKVFELKFDINHYQKGVVSVNKSPYKGHFSVKKAVPTPENGAQVDHIIPRVPANKCHEAGSNSFKNARVLKASRNRTKLNYPNP